MAWSETIGRLHSFWKFILRVIAETLITQETTQKTTQEIILDEIRRNPKVTRVELAALAGVSPDTVKYHLQKLISSGVLRREGSTRYGSWVLEQSQNKSK